ncbi:hypothetical protein GCM10027214_19380 [Stenotrophomonas tumulicola]
MRGDGLGTQDVTMENVATLRAYFERESKVGSGNWADFLRATGTVSSGRFESDWRLVQDKLRDNVVADFNAHADKEILLLVHGFNNNHGEINTWMEKFVDDVHRDRPDVHVVQMYWDGLRGNFAGIGIWGEAQFNGPRVGHGLRRILNKVEPNARLRIFTHSSAAFVVTNALGNGGGSYKGFSGKGNELVGARAGATRGDYRIPTNLTNLRVAMLVPAQPVTAFSHFRDESPAQKDESYQGVVPSRLILGTSKGDVATSKFLLPCNTLGTGNTCMAVRPKRACATVRRDLDQGGKPSPVYLVNFPRPWHWYHAHGVNSYKKSVKQWDELMAQLFEDDPVDPVATTTWCRKSA